MNLNLNSNLNKYLRPDQIQKINTFVNTTLGRLSLNILRPAFLIHRDNGTKITAKIPFTVLNQDFQNEIQSGIVVHAGHELARAFLSEQLVGQSYRISKIDLVLKKKLNWNAGLNLIMQTDLELFEIKIIEFQKNKKFNFEFSVDICIDGLKKSDTLEFKIEVQKLNLLT